MIDEFMKNLKKMLASFDMTKEEEEEIIKDYEEIAAEALNAGKSEEEVVELFGAPADIKEALASMYPQKKKQDDQNRFVAVSPFIALTAFILLGVFLDAWHPGWLVFLAVPVTAVFQGRKKKGTLSMFTALSPFLAITAFFLVARFTGVYNPTWMVFLGVVFFAFLHEKTTWKRTVLVASLLLSCALYLFVFFSTESVLLALPAFLIVIVTGILTGNILIGVDGLGNWWERGALILGAALFVLFGYLFNAWVVSWLFFLLLPITSIVTRKGAHPPFTALSPFFALTVFMLIGHFSGYWHPGWLVFLIIPVIGILERS